MTDGPIPQFDPIIHAQHRLRICAALVPWEEYEFASLRDVIGVSDSVLSKQLSALESARYVLLRRGLREGRQRVWVMLTELGREAFGGHVLALQEIVGAAGTTSRATAAADPHRPETPARDDVARSYRITT